MGRNTGIVIVLILMVLVAIPVVYLYTVYSMDSDSNSKEDTKSGEESAVVVFEEPKMIIFSGSNFIVSIPKNPRVTTLLMPNAELGQVPVQSYILRQKNESYMIFIGQYPKGYLSNIDPQVIANEAIYGFASGINLAVESDFKYAKAIKVGKNYGKEFQVGAEDGTLLGRVFSTDDRFYLIFGIYPKQDAGASVRIREFIDSFKIVSAENS